MATTRKIFRFKMKGQHSANDVGRGLGRHGGMLLRIDLRGGETQVFFEVDPAQAVRAARAVKKGVLPREATLKEIKTID